MRKRGAVATSVLIGLAGCSDNIGLAVAGETDITLATPETTYRWDDVTPGNGLVIEAVLVNQGDRNYYARLGDGFNTAEEQSNLFVATGSDGHLERLEGSDWVSVDRATLIEGVRFVVLTPGSSYTLMAYILHGDVTGTFRIRVRYGESEDETDTAGEALSNIFEIR